MATHRVRLSVPQVDVGNADLRFDIEQDGTRFGVLQVSRGSVEWLPSPKAKNGFRLGWSRFDELMQTHGREVKVRKQPRR